MGMFRRIRSLFRGEAVSRELDEEMDFHLKMREQRNIEEGMKPAEARRRARLRFGNPAVWRERVSEVDLLLLPQTVWQDVRFGSRMLKRHLGFTLTAIFALGLGIGVNTAAFTAYKAFFARKLDARDPASMVNLAVVLHSGATTPTFSYPDYKAFRDQVHAFSGVIAVSLPQYPTFTAPGGVEIHTDDGAGWLMGKLGLLPSIGTSEKAMTLAVSENYFSVLGVTALRGRLFEAKDASELEKAPAVVLSENFWQHRFLSDPAILGKTVRLNGAAFTVMGIAPHNFVGTFVAAPAIWLPLPLEPLVNRGSTLLTDREQECCHLHARLAPGSPIREAESEMTVVADHLRAFHNPHSNRAQQLAALVWPGSPFPLPIWQNRELRLSMLFVLIAVGMVLVVACANVASLQLARAATRQNELGMRFSLGASRARIVRQLLTESTLLAVLAGVAAFCFSWTLLQASVVLIADAFPDQYGTFVFHVTPDLSIFAFVTAISMATGFLFGLAPALESSRSAVASAIKANPSTSPARGRRVRHALIETQVAVSAVLVIAGSLMVHSAIRAASMDTGYDDRHTISLDLAFPGTPEYTPEHEAVLVRELRGRIAALPGVVDVISGRAPDDGAPAWVAVATNGEAPSPQNVKTYVYYKWVEPKYFATLGIPLLEGRGMMAQSAQPEPLIVLSESAARQIFPGQNPLGKTLRLGVNGFYQEREQQVPDGPVWRVIGVARDTRGVLVDGADSAMAYLPLAPDHLAEHPILIRTVADPQPTIDALAGIVTGVDGNLAAQAQTLKTMLRQTPPFLISSMAASVAMTTGLLGLLLVTVGIYGTVSYIVVQRTREVGIRMALGARRGNVLLLILRESARPVVFGLGIGLVLAAGVAWLLRHLLYGVPILDAVSFGGVSLLLLSVALLAAFFPSRRAIRVDPMVALRYE